MKINQSENDRRGIMPRDENGQVDYADLVYHDGKYTIAEKIEKLRECERDDQAARIEFLEFQLKEVVSLKDE